MVPVPPPDFRLVSVEPGPNAARVRRLALAAGAGAFALTALLVWSADAWALLLAGGLGLTVVAFVRSAVGPVLAGQPLSEASMSIVPWGVLVHDGATPRVLRWAAVREVRVECLRRIDDATPTTRWSVVRIQTSRETLGGRAPGDVALERLEANVEHYADEAARPLALDLDGTEALDDLLEPVVERLLAESHWLLGSGELGERLSLAPKSYRHAGSEPSTDTRGVLADVLCTASPSPADPRALAALLAAELGERALLDRILPLTASPHPILAAVARAAALRLGADIKRVGALDELRDFVPSADLCQLSTWSRCPVAALS
jgi:hypothetical protein